MSTPVDASNVTKPDIGPENVEKDGQKISTNTTHNQDTDIEKDVNTKADQVLNSDEYELLEVNESIYEYMKLTVI